MYSVIKEENHISKTLWAWRSARRWRCLSAGQN